MAKKLNVVHDRTDEKTPWYADGLRFSCTCSGNCCTGGPGYVWLSEEELGRLAEHLQITVEQARMRHCRTMGTQLSLKERRTAQGNYDCVFLKEEKIPVPAPDGSVRTETRRVCGIYPVRPLQCRTWPFWTGNLASQAGWDRASRRCPGMDRGRSFSQDQIEALRDATDWPGDGPTSDQ